MSRLLALLVLLVCPLLGYAEKPARGPADRAVERGLAYLKSSQNADGSWDAAGEKNAAITGLSVMAFLASGHVPGEGRYAATIDKGVRWVLRAQGPDGLIATEGKPKMYHHGICTLMLAEVAGMTDSDLGREVRGALEKGVRLTLQAQQTEGRHRGGWGYQPAERDYTDISIAGWQLLSLRAAKNIGCDVPAESIERAVAYVRSCWDPDSGGFFYYPGFRLSPGCTGSGVVSLEVCGREFHNTREARRAGDYLLREPPRWGANRFFYSVYYGAQASFQLGGEHWKSYRVELHRALLEHQDADGAWRGVAGEDARYGPNYGTATAALSLAVEYRYLPIYQSSEDR